MNRRELVASLISLVAAPAIVRAGSLMPVRAVLIEPSPWIVFATSADGQTVERMRVTRSGLVLIGEYIADAEFKGKIVC